MFAQVMLDFFFFFRKTRKNIKFVSLNLLISLFLNHCLHSQHHVVLFFLYVFCVFFKLWRGEKKSQFGQKMTWAILLLGQQHPGEEMTNNIHTRLPLTSHCFMLDSLLPLCWSWVFFVCVSLHSGHLRSGSSVHVVLVVPRHIQAIFTLSFTFRKWNHGWNIHGQLRDFTPRGCK